MGWVDCVRRARLRSHLRQLTGISTRVGVPRAAHSDTEELARAASAEAGMDPAERARLLHQQQENLREVRAAQKRAAKGVGGRGRAGVEEESVPCRPSRGGTSVRFTSVIHHTRDRARATSSWDLAAEGRLFDHLSRREAPSAERMKRLAPCGNDGAALGFGQPGAHAFAAAG